jgi:hypothetical protein
LLLAKGLVKEDEKDCDDKPVKDADEERSEEAVRTRPDLKSNPRARDIPLPPLRPPPPPLLLLLLLL